MDAYVKAIESLPETDRAEFYLILEGNEFSEKEKEILVVNRLRQILPGYMSNE